MTYQWRHNGQKVLSLTGNVLTVLGVLGSDAGSYDVQVSNASGTTTSSNASLSIAVSATISNQPQNMAVVAGQDASFSVVAGGTSPISYQWSFNGVPVANATNATLSLSSVQSNQAGSYTVAVTNAYGSVTSSPGVLTVYVPPSIATPPASQGVVLGQNASFSVAASGSGTFSYQWRFKGSSISGATAPTLSLTDVQASQAGAYAVVVTSAYGAVTSAPATLTVFVPAGIATQPTNTATVVGHGASFEVTASGTAPFSYQWNLDGQPVPNATNATLALNNVQTNAAGSYTVIVTNAWGAITSSVASLTVYTPPAVVVPPVGEAALVGQSYTFSVAASGTAPLAYQWRVNGAALAGANASTLTVSNLQTNQAGYYSVVITNAYGAVTSSVAALAVYAPAQIVSQPVSQGVVAGQNATFSASASGTAPVFYQWDFNGAAIPNATNYSLVLTNVQTNQAGSYTLVAVNPFGSETSSVVTLTVYLPPSITAQPVASGVVLGQNTSFFVTASGTAPLTYQWRLNGAALSGDNAATLSLTDVQTNQAGNYTVVVSNPYGAVTSSVASLAVYAPPAITNQPASQGVVLGQNATFSVGASGTGPLAYQWSLNGAALLDATNSVLALTNVQTSQAGGYSVVVTNAYGAVTSSVAALSVYVPPSITAQPVSQGALQNANASFTVVAAGTSPLSYRWSLNGAPLSGANSATLSLSHVQANQAGSYTVVVTNAYGAVTSSVATLAVYVPPSIAAQPASQGVVLGSNVTFSVTAGGTAPLSYQWNLNGAPLPGASDATLSLTAVQSNQAGSYTVIVTNAYGAVTSSVATLAVYLPPSITTQPSSESVPDNSAASFTVAAAGTAPLTYQWSLNGAPVSGANSATLSFHHAHLSDAGSYTVVVSNSYGAVTSAVATLTVYVLPGIATQPASQSVLGGADASFTVVAGGTSPLFYQWSLDGAPVAGANAATLSLTDVQTNQAGSYTVVVTNAYGAVTSSVATLTVDVPPSILTQPASQGVLVGSNVSFSVTAAGTTPLSYRWTFNGTRLSGARNATLSLTDVQTNDAGGYAVIVSNPYGAITSSVANLSVYVPPSLTNQPVSQAVIAGQDVSFSAGAVGSGPIFYQWQSNGAALTDATNSVLTLSAVQTNEAGSYFLIATNAYGAVTSSVAVLTIYVPPSVTTQPQSQSVTAGQSATFSVTASGTTPLFYQWDFNGYAIVGATNATLLLTNVVAANAGAYSVVLTNIAGAVTSSVANLFVTGFTLTNAPALAPSGFTLNFTAPVGATYVIFASTNLIDWTPIFTNTTGVAGVAFTDTNASNYTSRLYRAVVR